MKFYDKNDFDHPCELLDTMTSIFIRKRHFTAIAIRYGLVDFNGLKSWSNKPVFHNFCKQNNNGFIWYISPTV